jgi:hypothetical protein
MNNKAQPQKHDIIIYEDKHNNKAHIDRYINLYYKARVTYVGSVTLRPSTHK